MRRSVRSRRVLDASNLIEGMAARVAADARHGKGSSVLMPAGQSNLHAITIDHAEQSLTATAAPREGVVLHHLSPRDVNGRRWGQG